MKITTTGSLRNIGALLLLSVLFARPVSAQQTVAAQKKQSPPKFTPGAIWHDTEGKPINAHGGGLLYFDKTYYWFGEKRGVKESEGVSVYSSKDLYHWKPEGLALAQSDDTSSEIAKGGLMERPKVIYNKQTGKFVMWFHLELRGKGYRAARAGVAVSDKATGPYTYLHSFRPNGNMSRDMTLFVDDDGTAYEIYSSRDNYDMRVVKLSADYLTATTADTLLFSNHREAPAVLKNKGDYYLITSACTGWAPNKADIYKARSLFGPWQRLDYNPMQGPGADSTYGGQSTYILPVCGKDKSFVFIADRWNPKNLTDSRYLWLPIQFSGDKDPQVIWKEGWSLQAAKNRNRTLAFDREEKDVNE